MSLALFAFWTAIKFLCEASNLKCIYKSTDNALKEEQSHLSILVPCQDLVNSFLSKQVIFRSFAFCVLPVAGVAYIHSSFSVRFFPSAPLVDAGAPATAFLLLSLSQLI